MTAIAKTKFPRAKISRALGAALPKGQTFALHVVDSEIGKKKIVRVITPAWKRLRGWERIGKVLEAVNGELTPQEQKGILRFSVLTPDEYVSVVLDNLTATPRRAAKSVAAKKMVVQRKTIQKRKRAFSK